MSLKDITNVDISPGAPQRATISEAEALRRFGTVSIGIDMMRRLIFFGPGLDGHQSIQLGPWFEFLPKSYRADAEAAFLEAITDLMHTPATESGRLALIHVAHLALIAKLEARDATPFEDDDADRCPHHYVTLNVRGTCWRCEEDDADEVKP